MGVRSAGRGYLYIQAQREDRVESTMLFRVCLWRRELIELNVKVNGQDGMKVFCYV